MQIQINNIGNVDFVSSKRAKRLRISIKPFKAIRVSIPSGVSLSAAKAFLLSKENWVQKQLPKIRAMETEIRKVVENEDNIDVKAACEHLNQRLNFLAKKHNLHFNRITFRKQKTHWGSCSTKNNLNLNIKLIKLPQELQDYVILHELVHTRIKNHSPLFWQELEKVLPGARKLNKKLNKYKILAL